MLITVTVWISILVLVAGLCAAAGRGDVHAHLALESEPQTRAGERPTVARAAGGAHVASEHRRQAPLVGAGHG